MNDLLTREQLAKKLQISKRQVSGYVKKGLPVIKLSHKVIRYDYEEVLKWLKQLNSA